MIKLQELTPKVFYTKSRDFQFIGRLYDIVLNAAKTDADAIRYINDTSTCDSTLLNLLASTLGFKATRHYNTVQLRAICGTLTKIIRAKGSIRAVSLACDAVLAAEGLKETADYSFNNGNLTIFLPYTLSDTALIEDLFDYIIPAGISCDIIREMKVTVEAETIIDIKHDVKLYVSDLANDTPNAIKLDTDPIDKTLGQLVETNFKKRNGFAQNSDYPGIMDNVAIAKYEYPKETAVTNEQQETSTEEEKSNA